MKTGLEWAKEYGVTILDPDGFGERAKDMPLTTELMTEAQFQRGVGRSSCKFNDMDLFRSRYHAEPEPEVNVGPNGVKNPAVDMTNWNMECYVEGCDKILDPAVDKTCYRMEPSGVRHRCYWHGSPGSWYVPSLQRYALTLGQAKAKAIKYLSGSSAGYAPPEVKAEEQSILDEVERLMAMSST